MPTDSYKLGPGTLTLGTGLTEIECNIQLTNARVVPTENVTEGDDLNLLDGSTLDGEDNVTYDYTLEGTVVQDLVDTGVTAYTWEHKGEEVAFEFVPVTARDAAVAGTVRVVPLQIGGDVKTRNTADFTMACIGEPTFTPETP